jgi:3-hydroxyisobutyrate dehydrogenase
MPAAIHKIGFIGIGKMGTPMARHLAGAGFDLYLADARPQAVIDFLTAHGGSRLDREAADLDAIVTMLPDGRAVRGVLLGGEQVNGLASRLHSGGLVIDMSSSDPIGTRALGASLAERGIGMMDAPVSGGVIFAENGTLSVLAGGEADHLELCRPLFAALASDVFHCGALGSGHAVKALCNYVNAASLLSLLEAMTVGVRFGIKMETVVAALRAATTGPNHPLEKKIAAHIMTRAFGTGMALGLIAKDVSIACNLADVLSVRTPMMESCMKTWEAAVEGIGFNADQTEIARFWDEFS